MTRKSTDLELAGSTLAKLLPAETLADVLDALLSCDAEPGLSDGEAEAGGKLFGLLCAYRPDAMDLARTR